MTKKFGWSWLKRHKGNDDEDDNGPNRQDSIYEELRRRSMSIIDMNHHDTDSAHNRSRSSFGSRPSLQRVETTVKLRKITSGGRRVFVNLPLPKFVLSKTGKPPAYATNKIRTSKYTVVSFLPKNLFEQFRRPANMYFLIMCVIQMLPIFEVKSPALTLLPICTVVVISALKDGFEDFQRHKVDEQFNQNITHTLSGYENTNYPEPLHNSGLFAWFTNIFKKPSTASLPTIDNRVTDEPQEIDEHHEKGGVMHQENTEAYAVDDNADVFKKSLSKDVRVGDFILLRNGDSLPADAVLLSTSDKEGVCFVETKDLDGETNLKPRTSIQDLSHIQSGADCLNDCHFYIEAGEPNPDLYKFQGTLVTIEQSSDGKLVEKNKTPVEIENLLLRGHVVRNTKWAIAVVVFTGTDTKIMLNSGETPSKRSRVDKQMNQEIFVAFAVLFILCLICAVMASVMRHRQIDNHEAQLFTAQTESPAYYGMLNFFSSLIIFQNIIPISLYVSIEFVKTFQAFFIWSDIDMWDDVAKKTCTPKTWTLSDDLGQVEYIFSDKTGTLTRNIMEFRECSIGGIRYGNNGFSPESEGARGARLRREKEEMTTPDEENQNNALLTSTSHQATLINSDNSEDNEEEQEDQAFKRQREEIFKTYKQVVHDIFDPTYSSMDPSRLSFADPQLFKDMETSEVSTNVDEQSNRIKEFFMLLALCHTVVIERIGKDGKAEEDDDEEEEEESKVQPKVGESSGSKKNGGVVEEREVAGSEGSSYEEKKKKTHKLPKFVRVGGGKILKLPGLNHLKKSHKKKKRGTEFDKITEAADNRDRVDSTVKTQLDYKAESPDEAALVNAAKNAGFAFVKRKGKIMTVDVLGKEYDFELLNVLEFNSDRKRMSVILRRPDPWNDIVIYCKGADNVIEDRLASKDEIAQKTGVHTNEFSESGLRTLLTAYRVMDEQEYESWKSEMNEASTASENRSEKIAEVQEKIETNLKLLGATGIEDKLQEGVPQCIESLRRAEIKIWVLTGDKLQTAINIGYASNLLDATMKLWTVRGSDNAGEVIQSLEDTGAQLDELENAYFENNDFSEPMKENALIIEGSALLHIFESREAKQKFLDISIRCKSVVCCRVSPLQKALVVELVRKSQDVVTLAIGDGANDVSMIQVANVGVGISGQEGVQASMAADYAICQFRFLHKLLLVQGHWSYARISEMILTFFFKNIFWVLPALWFQIYSDWSGNIFYDYSFLQLYNIVFTLLPVIILGSTDQDLTAPYLSHLPQVYTIRGKLYTKFKFWIYFLDGTWQSLVVFYAFYFLHYTGNPNSNGLSDSAVQFSTSVAITALVLANLLPGFNTYYWTWWQFAAIGLELLIIFLWVVIYGAFQSTSLYGAANMVFGQGSFWLTFLLAIVLAMLPRYIIAFISQWWYPNVVARGRHLELFERRIRKRKAKEAGQTKSWLSCLQKSSSTDHIHDS